MLKNHIHETITSPIFDRSEYKYKMLVQGAGPSELFDNSISIVYENKTTALGLTT